MEIFPKNALKFPHFPENRPKNTPDTRPEISRMHPKVFQNHPKIAR